MTVEPMIFIYLFSKEWNVPSTKNKSSLNPKILDFTVVNNK